MSSNQQSQSSGQWVDNRRRYCPTDLHAEASSGGYQNISKAINEGTDLNVRDNAEWNRAPLHYAAGDGQTKSAIQLVLGGADVWARDSWGRTALHLAAKNGHSSTTALLTMVDSSLVNVPDNYGCTPLDLAAREGHTEVSEMLISVGASEKAQDRMGQTPHELGSNTEKPVIIHNFLQFF